MYELGQIKIKSYIKIRQNENQAIHKSNAKYELEGKKQAKYKLGQIDIRLECRLHKN